MLVFLRFLEVLEVLERSGRLKGRISPNVCQKRSGGFRVMTKKLEKFATIKSPTNPMNGFFLMKILTPTKPL